MKDLSRAYLDAFKAQPLRAHALYLFVSRLNCSSSRAFVDCGRSLPRSDAGLT
jgi:hypothetical protein